MNILHLNDRISQTGGTETYLRQLVELGPAYDIRAHWLGVERSNKGYEARLFRDPLPQAQGSLAGIIDYIIAFIRANQINLVHMHNLSDIGLIHASLQSFPVVRSMHEPRMFCPGKAKFWRFSERSCPEPFGLHCFWHAYVEGCSSRHPARLVRDYAVTRFERDTAATLYRKLFAYSTYIRDQAIAAGYPAEKIVVNPYFTSLEPSSPSIGSDDARRRLLYLGRIERQKGLHLFLAAVKPLLKKYPHLRVDVVGEGRHYSQLTAILAQMTEEGTSARVAFHGWQNRAAVNQFLAESYLMVFPSIYPEAFGISGIEAMAFGKPVVAFNVGGVQSWLQDHVTGFLVPPGDLPQMERAIDKLIHDRESYALFSRNARARVQDFFSPRAHFRILKSVYQDAIQESC